MSEKLDIKDKLKFDAVDLTSPDIAIAEIGIQLESVTNGFVKGVVNSYDGPIESYNALSGMASLVAALGTSQKMISRMTWAKLAISYLNLSST